LETRAVVNSSQVVAGPRLTVCAAQSATMPIDLSALRAGLGGTAAVCAVDLPFGSPEGPNRSAILRAWDVMSRCDGLFVRSGSVPAVLIDRCGRLRCVAVHGVGVEQVDVEACWARGVEVTNVPGGNANAVAELALALILDLARSVSRQDRNVRRGHWDTCRVIGRELQGALLGVLGFGNVGRLVSQKASALGMSVLANDAMLTDASIRAGGAEPVGLEELFSRSDFVSVHLPMTEQTRHLVDRRLLGLMKATAYLVNTSRGGVVDQEALADVLETRHIAGAGLDVQDPEPPLPGGRLEQVDTVVLLPHSAGSTNECLATIARLAGEDIARVLTGKNALNFIRGRLVSR